MTRNVFQLLCVVFFSILLLLNHQKTSALPKRRMDIKDGIPGNIHLPPPPPGGDVPPGSHEPGTDGKKKR
ncbi:unnamed protein product [Camellia sinensis]